MRAETATDAGERTMFAPEDGAVSFRAPNLPVSIPSRPADIESGPRRSRLAGIRSRLATLDARTVRTALAEAFELEVDRGILFLTVPVFLAIGALIYFALETEPGFLPLAASAAACGVAAVLARGNRKAMLTALALCLVLAGSLVAKLETWQAGTRMIGGEISTRMTGQVARIEHLANGRVRLTLDVIATERPALRYAPDRVKLSARRIPEGVVAGSQVSGLVKLLPPSGPVRPDAYDFSFQSYFEGVGATGYFMSGPELSPVPVSPDSWQRFGNAVERFRDRVATRIETRIGGAEGEIAAALVVGVRAGIPEPVNEALRRAGLYHIISISGLHMALVAGTIMAMMRTGCAMFPDFASRRPVKKYAAVAALVGLTGYLLISGAEVAAQRSYLMLAIMLVALLFDRAALTTRNLAIAAIVVMLVSPHDVVGPSFQMSYAATAGLVGAYAAWSDRRRATVHAAPSSRSLLSVGLRKGVLLAFGLASTSLIAGAATGIFAAWHFQQLSSLGLFANLAAMPVVSTLVMPFAVLGLLLMPLGLDGWCFDIMGSGLTATIAVAEWFSQRSPVDQVGPVPAAAVALFTIGLLCATLCTTWLRAFCLPFFLAGLVALPMAEAPDVLIAEDGRLVGVPVGEGSLAVNRGRPSEFTVENWMRVFVADELVKPVEVQAGPETPPGAKAGAGDDAAAAGFRCDGGLCLARSESGQVIAHAATVEAAGKACGTASVIVVEDASASKVCDPGVSRIVTLKDLARYGSAEVRFESGRAVVRHAIARPYRPWHTQRAFSREARGLPPYRPATKIEPAPIVEKDRESGD